MTKNLNRSFKKISVSFADRLTRKIRVTVLVIMAVTLAIAFVAAYRAMRGETIGRYLGMMYVVSEKIDMEIRDMKRGTNLSSQLLKIDEECRQNGMRNIDKLYSHLNFYSFIINSDGTYIAHPDSHRVGKENILSYVGDNFYSDYKTTITDIKQKNTGIAPMVVDGEWSDVYYTPLRDTDWSLVLVVPKLALVYPMIVLLVSLLVAIGLGQILVWFICRRNILKVTEPLALLTKSADEVAKGNFNAPLPELKYKDDISELRDAFATMQQSLEKYIHDLEETTAKKASMESELNVARTIQMSMIPKTFPKRSDIDLYGSLTPAKTVGGDLFDFFIRDERLFFCIGDVSGKGVPASLMMTVIQYLFRSISAHVDEPDRIIEIMNDCFSAKNKTMMFCTFFLGVLDLKTGLLQYCNAGHERPMLITSEVTRMTVDSNIALGVIEGTDYKPQELQLEHGTTIFLYTDGLTDATNSEEERIGINSIMATMQQIVDEGQKEAKDLVTEITDHVNAFVKEAPQADDLTLLAIRYE